MIVENSGNLARESADPRRHQLKEPVITRAVKSPSESSVQSKEKGTRRSAPTTEERCFSALKLLRRAVRSEDELNWQIPTISELAKSAEVRVAALADFLGKNLSASELPQIVTLRNVRAQQAQSEPREKYPTPQRGTYNLDVERLRQLNVTNYKPFVRATQSDAPSETIAPRLVDTPEVERLKLIHLPAMISRHCCYFPSENLAYCQELWRRGEIAIRNTTADFGKEPIDLLQLKTNISLSFWGIGVADRAPSEENLLYSFLGSLWDISVNTILAKLPTYYFAVGIQGVNHEDFNTEFFIQKNDAYLLSSALFDYLHRGSAKDKEYRRIGPVFRRLPRQPA